MTGQTTTFDIIWGEEVVDILTIDVGMYTDGSISGYKYNDLDGDGLWDAGEPGLSGWDIKVFDAFIADVQTDANGHYAFSGITPGDHSVLKIAQDGWTPTTWDITLTSGMEAVGYFGNTQAWVPEPHPRIDGSRPCRYRLEAA